MTCFCGDICCSSCGPAQGNYRCGVPGCRAWWSEGCKHFDMDEKMQKEIEAEAKKDDDDYARELEEEKKMIAKAQGFVFADDGSVKQPEDLYEEDAQVSPEEDGDFCRDHYYQLPKVFADYCGIYGIN